MKKIWVVFAVGLLTAIGFIDCGLGQKSENNPQKIILIRHGEKPDKGDNLSCQGLNRALQLADVLQQKIGIPDAIMVPSLNEGKKTSSARMYQTIVPFAVKYNLNINSKYQTDDIDKIVDGLRKQTGTVLMIWEHKNIGKIVKALGLKDAGKWDDNDFDSIWIITYKNGVPTLTRQSEGIRPSATCP